MKRRIVGIVLAVLLVFGAGYGLAQWPGPWDTPRLIHLPPAFVPYTHVVASTYEGTPVLFLLNQPTGDVWVYHIRVSGCVGAPPVAGWICVDGGWRPAGSRP